MFLGVFVSETQKLQLRKIELNSHSSEHVLVGLLNNLNAEKIHTFVNSGDQQVAPCGGDGNSIFVVSLSPVLVLNCFISTQSLHHHHHHCRRRHHHHHHHQFLCRSERNRLQPHVLAISKRQQLVS